MAYSAFGVLHYLHPDTHAHMHIVHIVSHVYTIFLYIYTYIYISLLFAGGQLGWGVWGWDDRLSSGYGKSCFSNFLMARTRNRPPVNNNSLASMFVNTYRHIVFKYICIHIHIHIHESF